MRALLLSFLGALALPAQLPPGVQPDLRFEVASLKPVTVGNPMGYSIHPAAGGERYVAENCPIRLMLQVAFRIRPEQVAGIPTALDDLRFDMQAKAEKPSSADELHVMLLNLLADRMHLTYHMEKRNKPMYALLVSHEGAKLTRRPTADGDTLLEVTGHNLQTSMVATNAPLNFLAFRLADEVSRPVVDMTGLGSTYDFQLHFTRQLPLNFPPGGKIGGQDPDTSGLNLFTALKQQLGLELKSQTGPVDVVVVDHLEKPIED